MPLKASSHHFKCFAESQAAYEKLQEVAIYECVNVGFVDTEPEQLSPWSLY